MMNRTRSEEQFKKSANAFISKVENLGFLLDSVYTHTVGEIWLFDNDLKVLEDYRGFNSFFYKLYVERIDGSLSTNIRSIKIILRPELYDRFFDKDASPHLYNNLRQLRKNRLKTLYVGNLANIKPHPPKKFGGHIPWIFYLSDKLFEAKDGVVIVRPGEFPFYCEDSHDDLAIAWQTSDPKAIVMLHRLSTGWFRDVFIKNYKRNFVSIDPEIDKEGNIINYRPIKCRTNAEIYSLHKILTDKRPRKVISPVDCLVVTTLDEEYEAAIKAFNLDNSNSCEYATGWINTTEGQVSVAVTQCQHFGSVCSAETTARALNDWSPRAVFLIGRCGGWKSDQNNNNSEEDKLIEGDVIISNGIYCYEYQLLKKTNDPNKPYEEEYQVRPVPTSDTLRKMARNLVRIKWEYKGTLPEDWGTDRRKPKAIVGDFACGCKLIRAGTTWFEAIKKALGQRKIIATEMEGEGVGWIARDRHIDFLMIKGISDFADPDKTDKYAKLASDAAASFLLEMLSQPGITHYIK